MMKKLLALWAMLLPFVVLTAQDCELEITATDYGCGLFVFEATGQPDGAAIYWEAGGDVIGENTNLLEFQFELDGAIEVCAGYITMTCMEGVYDCIEITSEICEPDCNLAIETVDNGCGNYVFEAYDFPEGAWIYWEVDGEIVANNTHIIDWDFGTAGSGVVQAAYETPECPEGVFLTVDVLYEPCVEECGLEIGIEEYSCGHYGLFAYPSEDVVVDWYINEEYFTTLNVSDWDPEDGEYIICAHYVTDACPEGIEVCMEYVVNCDEECELGISVEGSCGAYSLFAIQDVVVDWYINEEYYNTGNGIDWDPEDGEYVVCALYESEACPEGVEACMEFVVDCSEECELEIGIEEYSCGHYGLFAYPSEDVVVDWYINEEYFTTLNVSDWDPEDGEYIVCAHYVTDACPEGIEVCMEYIVDCESDCPTEDDFYGSQFGEDCLHWIFEIGSFVEGEEVTWYFGDEVMVEGGHFIEHTFEEPGEYMVCADYYTPECPEGVELCMEIVVGCEEDCSLEFDYEVISCDNTIALNIYGLEWNPDYGDSWYEIIEYDLGDGQVIYGSPNWVYATYEEAGFYTVTATVMFGPCEGATGSWDVEIVACSCPEGITAVINDNSQCSSYGFYLEGYYLDGNDVSAVWDFGDGVVFDGWTSYAGHTYDEPGEYTVTCWYSAPWCPDETEFTIDIVVDFCEDDCLPEEYFYTYDEGNDCQDVQLVLDWDEDINWYVNEEYVGTGYSTLADLQDGWNLICAELEPQEGCPLGDEVCFEVEADCSSDCPTEADFYAGESLDGCLSWVFEVGSFVSGLDVTWFFGDGTVLEGGHFAQHVYEEPGTYQVEVVYYSDECPEGVELSITIEVECSDCGLEVEWEEVECGLFAFAAFDYPENATLFWETNENIFAEGTDYVEYQYLEEGWNSMCVFYETPECPEGVFWCTEFYVESCDGDCPTEEEFYADNVGEECYVWEFEIGSFEEGEAVTWYFGDGTVVEGGHYAQHEYSESGIYEVCAFFTSNECPEGVELCVTIEVLCGDCYLEVGYEIETCEAYNFFAYNDSNSAVEWYYDGELVWTGQEYFAGFSTEGWHTICAVYESDECDPIEWCEEFYIDYDDCNCQEVGFAFDSDISEGGPEIIGWTVFNNTTGELEEEGFCEYTEDYPYCDALLCLPDGCYTVNLWGIGNDFDGDWEGIFSAPFIGEEQLEIYNISEDDCECYVSYDFSLNSDCEEEEDCYLELSSEQLTDFTFVFEAGAPESIEMFFWDYGDGVTEEGNQNMDYTYSEPGIYEVCVSYETEACGFVESCVTVVVEEDDCTEVVIAISADIDEFELELLGWFLESEGFELDGELPLTSINGELELTYCVPDGCYSFGIEAMDGLLDLLDIEINIYVEDVLVGTMDDLVNSEGGEIVFAVNADCVDGISELDFVNFEVYPNPAMTEFNIELNAPAQRSLVQIYNLNGQLIYESLLSNGNNFIDATDWASGIYQIQITSDDSLLNQKIIIH